MQGFSLPTSESKSDMKVGADELRSFIGSIEDELVETRHYLHERPELSYEEEKTSAYVAERLRALGLKADTGVGGYGVLATLEGARPGKTLGIRADMDALPIQEENE